MQSQPTANRPSNTCSKARSDQLLATIIAGFFSHIQDPATIESIIKNYREESTRMPVLSTKDITSTTVTSSEDFAPNIKPVPNELTNERVSEATATVTSSDQTLLQQAEHQLSTSTSHYGSFAYSASIAGPGENKAEQVNSASNQEYVPRIEQGYSRVQDDNPTTTSSYEPMMTFSDGASSTKASVPLLEAVEISPPESPREITVYDENEKGEIIPTKIYLSPYISRAEAHLRTLALGPAAAQKEINVFAAIIRAGEKFEGNTPNNAIIVDPPQELESTNEPENRDNDPVQDDPFQMNSGSLHLQVEDDRICCGEESEQFDMSGFVGYPDIPLPDDSTGSNEWL